LLFESSHYNGVIDSVALFSLRLFFIKKKLFGGAEDGETSFAGLRARTVHSDHSRLNTEVCQRYQRFTERSGNVFSIAISSAARGTACLTSCFATTSALNGNGPL
jgi:hypothetical protein